MLNFSSEEILENIKNAGFYYQKVMMHLIQNKTPDVIFGLMDNNKNSDIAKAIFDKMLNNPEKFAKINLDYVNDFQKLIVDSLGKFAGHPNDNNANNKIEDDKRFKDPAWNQNIYFDFVKQFYLMNSKFCDKYINEFELKDDRKSYLDFFTRQFIDAMSPSNFIFSNPEVIRESLESGMKNISQGMQNFFEDIQNSGGILNITTTDKKKFRVGKNIAITPGKVIYRNSLVELICYEPQNKTHEIPMLILPPWINKFYILDLSKENSLVKWLIDNNYQVFMISWINPGKELSDKDFEDYLKDGVIDVYEHLKKLGYDKINACGYCIGGTLLACALSYLKEINNEFINSASFLTTLIDFSKPGDIGAFINDRSIEMIEKEVKEKGFLDGKYISNSFGLIRANDLVWSFFVNNYLLGKSPAAFDILYWNSDSTNLPAKMYIYYLRNMYLDNNLVKPGKLTILNKKIDITKINIPSFSLAAKRDHIALWDGVYEGYKLLGGHKTFCITEAGHVAGVVNPAHNTKYAHRISSDIVSSPKEWFDNANIKEGSWWNSWNRWLASNSGSMKPSIEYDKIQVITNAPGNYVLSKNI